MSFSIIFFPFVYLFLSFLLSFFFQFFPSPFPFLFFIFHYSFFLSFFLQFFPSFISFLFFFIFYYSFFLSFFLSLFLLSPDFFLFHFFIFSLSFFLFSVLAVVHPEIIWILNFPLLLNLSFFSFIELFVVYEYHFFFLFFIIPGFDSPTNFTLQTTNGTSELSVGKLGSTSFRLPKGDYAFIRSFQTTIAVSSTEPSPDNPNITLLSTVLPLTHYQNLAYLKLPLQQPNDCYTLVTTFQENCNQSYLSVNTSDFRSYQIFTNVSGRTFSIYRTFNKTLLKTLVDDIKNSRRGLSSRACIFRLTRGFLRPYPFPVNLFPVFNCPGEISGSNLLATTPVTPWLLKYLRGNDVDEDCDGKMDEELPNELDDDGDGLVDEDIVFGCSEAIKGAAGINSTKSDVPLKFVDISRNLHFHPSNSYYHASILALVVSLAVAIWAAAMLLGGSLLWEYHRRESARRSTSVSPIFEDW